MAMGGGAWPRLGRPSCSNWSTASHRTPLGGLLEEQEDLVEGLGGPFDELVHTSPAGRSAQTLGGRREALRPGEELGPVGVSHRWEAVGFHPAAEIRRSAFELRRKGMSAGKRPFGFGWIEVR